MPAVKCKYPVKINKMEVATQHNSESSYSCDISMFQSDDLSMYADIIDELCQEPVKLPKRRGKIYSRCYRRPSWSSTSEHHSSASPSSGSDLEEPPSSLSQSYDLDYNTINSEFSDIFSYFDKDVDLAEYVADCIEETCSQANILSPSAKENITNKEVKRSTEPFRCQVKNVIYKKRTNSLKPNGRLRSLVNLFENCNLEQKEFDDEQKSNKETTLSQLNNGSVRKIVQLYQQQMQGNQNTAERKQHHLEEPLCGKFDIFRNSLENFFRDRCCFNEEQSAKHSIRNQENVRPSYLKEPSTDGMDNMLIKYNRLKSMKTFLENHNAMKHCHEVCTNMSDRLLDGIENTIVAHEDQMYKYFEKLEVNFLVDFSYISHHFRLLQ